MAHELSLLLALGTCSPYVHQLFFHLLKDDQTFLHRAANELKMASLCQICGNIGFEELLEYCRKCRTSAEHRYCLPKLPKPDEKVILICEACKSRSVNEDSLEKPAVDSGRSNNVSFLQLQNRVSNCSQREMFECESSPCVPPEQDNGRKTKKRRRLVSADEGQLDHAVPSGCADQDVANRVMKQPSESEMALSPPYTNSSEVTIRRRIAAPKPSATQATIQEEVHDDQHLQQSARPIYGHIWRGCISFGDEKYGPITAHLSTLACQRVYNAAKLLPPVLHMEKLPRLDSLPNSFKNSPPGGDNIGLFFLPNCTMVEPLVDQLLADVIQKDLVFKCILDEVELLMFPSTILPKENHRFQEKHYLWGAFRRRQVSVISSIAECRVAPSNAKEENQRMEVSDENTGDEEEGLGRGEPDGSHSSSFPFSPYYVLQHPKSNELSEEIQRSEDMSKDAGENKVVEARDGDPQEREEGDIWAENTSTASEVGGRQNKEIESHNEKPQDLEEGEILEDEEHEETQCARDPEEVGCLPLFPLDGEDLGFASRIGSRNELNLDLGL